MNNTHFLKELRAIVTNRLAEVRTELEMELQLEGAEIPMDIDLCEFYFTEVPKRYWTAYAHQLYGELRTINWIEDQVSTHIERNSNPLGTNPMLPGSD